MIDSYQVSQAISVAATLGIADLLSEASRSTDELASITGAHPPSLRRLLRALTTVGVFTEETDGRFALTPLAELLRTDRHGALRDSAVQSGQAYMWAAWGHLMHSVMTGGSAFQHVHGMSAWEYRKHHQAAGERFDDAMTASAQEVAASILAAYSFADVGRVVDVGGGQGASIAAILVAHPALRGVLFDQRHVVNGAHRLLRDAGVSDRCEVEAGDFFEAIPEGGNVYILKGILHDWNDADAVQILRTCRNAMDAQAKLILVEQVIPRDHIAERFTLFMDLHMLTIHGASERTSDDFAELLAWAGFRLMRILPTQTSLNLLEAIPAVR